MHTARSFRRHARIAAVLLLALAACERLGIDHSSSGASVSEFSVVSIDIPASGILKLNRRIRFEFNDEIDFASVSSSSIAIRAWNGVPAVGEYFRVDGSDRAIDFRPRCPHNADLSDAGLRLATHYDIDLPGIDSSVLDSVRSKSGLLLAHATHAAFDTPSSAANAFRDTQHGPPRALARAKHSGATHTSYIELGGDTTRRVYFERDEHGNASIDPELDLPLALHSEGDSRVVFVIAFDQSIDVSTANIARIVLEYRGDAGAWRAMTATNELHQNCTPHGALVRVESIGSLPSSSDVRVLLRAGFSDIVGQALAGDAVELALLRTQMVEGPLHDEILEDFTTNELEDTSATFSEPRAFWRDGKLEMDNHFDGTGGSGGDFDFEVPVGALLIFDTTHMTILGGPGFAPQREQVVVDGVLDVRNFKIGTGATLRAQGPNPLVILASGDVQIDGRLDVSGWSRLGSYQYPGGHWLGPRDYVSWPGTFGYSYFVEVGAPGQAGGGRGGDGHPTLGTTAASGGAGRGAFDTLASGGQGGETGWSLAATEDTRRGAGGGGGRFGPDVPNTTTGSGAFDQRRIGLDAEKGFNNLQGYAGALHGVGAPIGGAIGSSPFVDADASNNFFGVSVDEFTGARSLGELIKPWAGAGGGGGGDATVLPTPWPPPPGVDYENVGGGAGGGGGAVRIIALGHVRIGASGQILARGGAGGGGANTLFLNRVGGAGGGGSGGHVIIESATTIEFAYTPNQPGILATGGEGGAGAQDAGGAIATSAGQAEQPPAQDACPPGYSTSGVNACKGHVNGAGGDGGPGVIQLHLFHGIDDVLLPIGKSLADVCQPPPLCDWGTRHLTPSIETRSRTRSKWIALGLGGFDASTDTLAPSEFEFVGTDTSTGRVLTTAGQVDLAPPIFGPSPLAIAPSTPNISQFGRVLVVDASAWIGTDLAYLLERPHLLRHATIVLRAIDSPALQARFDVAAAQRIDATARLALTVDGDGPRLDHFLPGGPIDAALHPTWLRAAGNGEFDTLPDSSSIRIGFQATSADANGLPDESAVNALFFDAAELNDFATQHPFCFVRFDVLFLGAAAGNTNAQGAARPALDFLRLPWRWSRN